MAKSYPYNPVQGSWWKAQQLYTDISEQKLVYKKSQPIAERTFNPSMQRGFSRNHQTKYASTACLAKARVTEDILSEGFKMLLEQFKGESNVGYI